MSLNSRTHRTQPQSSDRGAVALHMDAQHDPAGVLYAAGGAEPLSKAERKQLLEAVRGGEAVELEMEIVPFIQRATPNRNFVRFPPGKLAGFAKSYEGMPFLKDHASYDLASRGGTIVASKLEHNEDGSKQFRMRVRLVKPWAVESALDGTLDRFSIGWDRNGLAVQCSVHLADFWSCSCRLGSTLEDGRRVELLVTEPTGTEASAVNVPAVVGTGIESISQLGIDTDRLADTLVRNATPSVASQEGISMDPKLVTLFAVLGLSATASYDDAIKATEKLAADRDEAIEQRDELKVGAAAAEKAATEKLAADRKVIVKSKLAALKAAGKLKPGSKREERLLARAERDFEDFVEQCDELLANGESVTAAGAPALAATADPAGAQAASTAKAEIAANPSLAAMMKSAGISEADVEKHGGHGLAYVEATRAAR